MQNSYIQNYSFTPKINEVSKILIELEDPAQPDKSFNFDMTRAGETQKSVKLTGRSKSKCKSTKGTQNRYGARVKSKPKTTDEHTFKPQLSQKSLQMAKKLGRSRDRLTKPKKKFNDTRKSLNNLTRDHMSKSYLNTSKSPSAMNSKSFFHFSENYDPTMNESFKPNINKKSRKIDREMSKSPGGQARFERLYNNHGKFDSNWVAYTSI